MTEYEREERKKQKEILKQKLKLIKQVNIWFKTRYKSFCEDIIYNRIEEEEVTTFLNYEEPIYAAIERIKIKIEEQRKREVYNAIINNNKPLLKRLLEECKTNLTLYNEELERTNNWRPYSQKEILTKKRKITKLENNISNTNALIKKLIEKDEENKKAAAKKRGRPSNAEAMQNKLENFINETSEELQYDEDWKKNQGLCTTSSTRVIGTSTNQVRQD